MKAMLWDQASDNTVHENLECWIKFSCWARSLLIQDSFLITHEGIKHCRPKAGKDQFIPVIIESPESPGTVSREAEISRIAIIKDWDLWVKIIRHFACETLWKK